MPYTTYRTFNVIPGTFISENIDFLAEQGANPSPPSWFDWVINDALGFDALVAFSFTAPNIPATFEIFFVSHFDHSQGYKIIINVQSDDFDVYSNCCETEANPHRNIAWYNIQGGWQNYIFTGIKTFRVEVGGNKQFKTNQLVSKHQRIEGVFNGEIITAGDIPKSHVDYIDGLRYSIQAFLYNSITQTWDIPILIDLETFTKYETRDKFFDVRLKFIYAEEILVQTQ